MMSPPTQYNLPFLDTDDVKEENNLLQLLIKVKKKQGKREGERDSVGDFFYHSIFSVMRLRISKFFESFVENK
jgi:hypothetical protein